jgi:hypothetical protein
MTFNESALFQTDYSLNERCEWNNPTRMKWIPSFGGYRGILGEIYESELPADIKKVIAHRLLKMTGTLLYTVRGSSPKSGIRLIINADDHSSDHHEVFRVHLQNENTNRYTLH